VYLKRLEIQGFKSFAGRSSFEFEPGITAIVGPNGSGKSNLADALRWVLGEQNPRVLRSRRIEDVIFAGDRKRPPAGFAEVSLTLENASHWLPLDFDEVVLTRRLHRSGESEYLINRARVRLKDVLDLLARGRVGQNSYAIMGQGLVDQVLNLRPEDRRALIEEAADVRRHRISIEDAVGRLGATRENLDRVGLLAGELGPRVQQLELQARRAAEYTALTDELAATLRALYAVQWRERSEALVAAREEYARRAEQVVAINAAVERAAREVERLNADLAAQREVAGTGEAALRDLDDRVRRAEGSLAVQTERSAMLQRRQVEIERDIARFEAELAELRAAAEDAGEEAAGVPDGEAIAAFAEQEREAREAHSSALRALNDADDALRLSRGRAGQVEDRLARAERGLRALEREHEEVGARHAALLARLKRSGVEVARLLRELAGADSDEATLREEATSARRALGTARESAERIDADVAAIARELDGLRARLEMVSRLALDQRSADGAINALVEAARRAGPENPPRLVDLLSSVIKVQRGVETAIEAALEGALDAVLVAENVDVAAAVRVLNEAKAGRATLLPLKDFKAAHPVNLSSERGVLGVASRFIKCDSRYRPLVDTLLGRVIIVEDLATGQAMLRRGLGTVVTLDGAVLRPTGVVTAGAGAATGLALQFARDLEELPAQIVASEARYAARQQEATRARTLARDAEGKLREIDARLDGLHNARRRLTSDLAAARSRISGQRGEAASLRTIAGGYAGRRTQLEMEARELEQERARAQHAVRSAQLVVEDARRAAERARNELDIARAEAATAAGARQAFEQHRATLARLQEGRRLAVERSERALAARQGERERLQQEIAALEGEYAAGEAALVEIRVALEAQRLALQPQRERLSRLAAEEREQQAELARGRASLLQAERAALEAEAAVNRRGQAFERLREEIDADGVELAPEQTLDLAPVLAAVPVGRQAAVSGAVRPEQLGARVRALRAELRAIGPVNAQAEADFAEAAERHRFLTTQMADLQQAEHGLRDALDELRRVVRDRFRETFHAVNADFQRYFKTFFGGGSARLALTEPEDYSESGVDVLAQPPGKRQQHLALLSGGERSMAAVALLFALLESNPAPFCVLDEVDAALDEANVVRFSEALGGLGERTQFILISHNRATVQAAQAIYGVSMGGDGVSTVLSLRLEDVPASA
jgi:chromosome segregation protein